MNIYIKELQTDLKKSQLAENVKVQNALKWTSEY